MFGTFVEEVGRFFKALKDFFIPKVVTLTEAEADELMRRSAGKKQHIFNDGPQLHEPGAFYGLNPKVNKAWPGAKAEQSPASSAAYAKTPEPAADSASKPKKPVKQSDVTQQPDPIIVMRPRPTHRPEADGAAADLWTQSPPPNMTRYNLHDDDGAIRGDGFVMMPPPRLRDNIFSAAARPESVIFMPYTPIKKPEPMQQDPVMRADKGHSDAPLSGTAIPTALKASKESGKPEFDKYMFLDSFGPNYHRPESDVPGRPATPLPMMGESRTEEPPLAQQDVLSKEEQMALIAAVVAELEAAPDVTPGQGAQKDWQPPVEKAVEQRALAALARLQPEPKPQETKGEPLVDKVVEGQVVAAFARLARAQEHPAITTEQRPAQNEERGRDYMRYAGAHKPAFWDAKPPGPFERLFGGVLDLADDAKDFARKALHEGSERLKDYREKSAIQKEEKRAENEVKMAELVKKRAEHWKKVAEQEAARAQEKADAKAARAQEKADAKAKKDAIKAIMEQRMKEQEEYGILETKPLVKDVSRRRPRIISPVTVSGAAAFAASIGLAFMISSQGDDAPQVSKTAERAPVSSAFNEAADFTQGAEDPRADIVTKKKPGVSGRFDAPIFEAGPIVNDVDAASPPEPQPMKVSTKITTQYNAGTSPYAYLKAQMAAGNIDLGATGAQLVEWGAQGDSHAGLQIIDLLEAQGQQDVARALLDRYADQGSAMARIKKADALANGELGYKADLKLAQSYGLDYQYSPAVMNNPGQHNLAAFGYGEQTLSVQPL